MNRQRIARWAVLLGAAASLAGCVVYPYGRGRVVYRTHAEVVVPAPVPR